MQYLTNETIDAEENPIFEEYNKQKQAEWAAAQLDRDKTEKFTNYY